MKERLMEFIKEKDISNRKFLLKCGLSGTYINTLTGNPSGDTLKKIEAAYPELNTDWLLTGEGEMLKVPATMTIYNPTADERKEVGSGVDLSVIPAEIVEEIQAEAKKDAVILPPIIPENIARRPNLDVMQWLEDIDDEHLPHAIELTSRIKRTKAIFQVTNNAMAPVLYQGEYAFLKPFIEGQTFTDGDIHVIDTKQRGMMVYALYDRGEHILCKPKNSTDYGDLLIPKAHIIRLYHILFHGSIHLASVPDLDRQQYAKQGEQIDNLIAQIDKAGEREDRLINIIEKNL